MHLERLEISGFKSFSDRSELAFDRGVTAIVGPNGCGKSNVADALTWVLGEQSAKSLRGDKMEDVIFNGSDARKPTGAAEVRLRFGNVIVPPSLSKELGEVVPAAADDDLNGHSLDMLAPTTREVEVTRRLFRSGESEYLIDGQQCRLKDIHELLMDTGLGAKAYAIIEQGKIGMILSSRPTDRRQLIEEAAGITKYKARRRAAELKLDAAQQNLTRLDDIVYELDKQRGSLKRQAYVDVIAFILERNGAPAGKAELPTDPKALKALTIRYPQRTPLDDQSAWDKAFTGEMRRVFARFRGDLDVACALADAIMIETPWQMWDLDAGGAAKDAGTQEAMELLEGIFAGMPASWDHPGLLHLYVHLMEMSPFPQRALRQGDRLRELVPESGHLVHMPTHLDVLCGNYRDVVVYNQKAVEVDRKYLAREGAGGVYTIYRSHNHHFIVYGAMFLGQFEPVRLV